MLQIPMVTMVAGVCLIIIFSILMSSPMHVYFFSATFKTKLTPLQLLYIIIAKHIKLKKKVQRSGLNSEC